MHLPCCLQNQYDGAINFNKQEEVIFAIYVFDRKMKDIIERAK